MGVELVLDDVEEGGPLAEDDGFGARFAVRGFEDAEERFGFTAARVRVEGEEVIVESAAFAEPGRGADQAVDFEGFGATHGAAVLGLDDAFDAFVSEDVRTGCYDWVVELFEADWAIFSRVDA